MYVSMHSCDRHGQGGSHLATCTFPVYRDYGRPPRDKPFCPFPPSVNKNIDPGATGQPLEYMSYFVDDYLINLSDNQIDTTEFFRQYMAGFVISTRETALSVCRSNFVNSSTCQMILASQIVEGKRTFTGTGLRQNYQNATNCTRLFSEGIKRINGKAVLSYWNAVGCAFQNYTPPWANNFPNCSSINFDADNETFSFVSNSGMMTDVSQITADFSVDGAVRNIFDRTIVNGVSRFGRVHYAPASTQITGATVYYNNQVTCIWLMYVVNYFMFVFAAIPHACCCSKCFPHYLLASLT